MRTHDFPVCCGAKIITDFGFTNNFHSGDGPTQSMSKAQGEAIQDYLKRHITGSHTGMTVIMLNSAQVKAGVEKLVLDAGWELATDAAFYPGHGRYLTLYVYYHHPKERKERVSKDVHATRIPVQNVSSNNVSPDTGIIKTEAAKPGPVRTSSKRLFSDTLMPPSSTKTSTPKKRTLGRVGTLPLKRTKKKKVSYDW